MKRGCLVSLLVWAALSAGFYYYLHGRYTPPADRWGAIAAGFFTGITIGALRTARQSGKDAARVEAASRGDNYAAPQDGETLAAFGTIRALREPPRSPFTNKPAVMYSYEIDHQEHRNNGWETVRDYSGVVLTPCAIDTPYGPVRILTWPALEGFGKARYDTDEELDNARQYLRSTPLTKISGFAVTTMYRQMKDLLTDDDGEIRKDWQLGESDPELPDHILTEELIPNGEQVCAIGRWSQQHGGLLPDRNGGQVRIVRGGPEQVISQLRAKRTSNMFWGVLVGLIANGAIFGVLTAREASPSTQRVAAASLFDAVRAGDLHAMREAVDNGSRVNSLDPSSDEPALFVAPDGKTATWLIEHGADVNARNSKGETPLIVHSAYGHTDVVRALLEAHASLEAVDHEFRLTALKRALDAEHLDVAQLLREAGAKDDTVTELSGAPIDESHPAFAVVREYLAAVFDEKPGSLHALSTFKSFDGVDFKVWKASRTREPRIVSAFAGENAATITVRGPRPDGGSTTWTYQLVRQDGVWRVSDERWETRMENR
ncbi:MAG TPA: ankyrin repeat domain-containing protein [Thermoanaerobaculia bacterium]|nr:ankyrin repeat domain-containing protein [Thermoanaerobaculia bacterium]